MGISRLEMTLPATVGYASVRNIVNEVLVGKTDHSYTYTQPVRNDAKYNLYHGTLEAVPVTAKTSRLIYTFFYDNSLLADDAARDAISPLARSGLPLFYKT